MEKISSTEIGSLRVMQVLVGEPMGGAERFFVKLVSALARRGLDQQVVIKSDQKRSDQLRALGLEPLQFDFKKGLGDIPARFQLRRAIKSFRPHVINVWMDRAARRIPRGNYTVVGRLGGYYRLKHYKNCDWLIGNTPDIVDYIKREGWPNNRAVMISNFGELEPASAVKRADLDTPAKAFLVVALGRLHESKGFDTLLDSVRDKPEVYIWLAGDGTERNALTEQAKRNGIADRVKFLGWRDDQAALLSAADVCVVPSRHEPLSNVIIEAWSLSVPVIAAASEGPSWLVSNGKNGLLVPVDDTTKLATALQYLQQNPSSRKRIAHSGNEKWINEFSENSICDQYIDLYMRVHLSKKL